MTPDDERRPWRVDPAGVLAWTLTVLSWAAGVPGAVLLWRAVL